jgi:uracil-DNA glycosylase
MNYVPYYTGYLKRIITSSCLETIIKEELKIMSDYFCPVAWPEESTPGNFTNCCECGLYKHGTRMVWGEGNPNAPIMIILDNPGAREDREGNAFVCGTRQTLQESINEVGLKESDVYATYIVKRKPTRAYDKELTRKICMQHLHEQLEEKKPRLIICLGNVAAQSFFENDEVDVKGLRGGWHNIKGYATTVAYHPLAVRRRPNLKKLFLQDWKFVAERYRQLT